MMMAARMTESCWGLPICNKIHCTKVHSLVYNILYKIMFFSATVIRFVCVALYIVSSRCIKHQIPKAVSVYLISQ